jgi:hypothetical protein
VRLYVPPRNRIFGPSDALGVIGLLGLAVARWVPVARLVPFWGCTFRKVFDVPCPGCGLTRVADRVAHFHVVSALHANPLGTVAALGFAAAVPMMVLHLGFGVPVPELVLDEREWSRAWWVIGFLLLLNYAFVIFAWRVLHYR